MVNRSDRGPDEGGPDTGLPQPQGPTTKVQVARKGFDPRRSLADQTINPDIVERVNTMVSAVDEAYSGVSKNRSWRLQRKDHDERFVWGMTNNMQD